MRLYVAATGSSANCYILSSNDGESLILDAGVDSKKVLPHIPDVRRILGCLVTHEHGDHARAWLKWYFRGIPTVMSEGTFSEVNLARRVDGVKPRLCKKLVPMTLGSFTIMPFDVQHDAAEPMGFLIRYDPTGETLVYATDTYYLKYTFPGVNYWLVECNYCEDLVDAETDLTLRRRLKESHMSLRRLRDALRKNDLNDTAKIVLVHLSDQRSDEQRMVSEIQELTGIETVAANAGMTIELERIPF